MSKASQFHIKISIISSISFRFSSIIMQKLTFKSVEMFSYPHLYKSIDKFI